jgi:hypothetical protein
MPFTSISNITLNLTILNGLHVSADGSKIIACGPSTRFTLISSPFAGASNCL